MQLIVHVRGLGENGAVTRWTLDTFADQEKVAAQIARAVRNWIRVVPVRNSGSRLDLTVTAEWLETKHPTSETIAPPRETAPRPKRKPARRKRGK